MTPPRATRADRQAGRPGEIYDDGRLRVEHDNYHVECDGRSLRLPLKEFLILSRLARSAGRVVAAEEIRRHAWRDGSALNQVSLHVHIYRLRRRLRPFGFRIEVMVNVGYRLLPPLPTGPPEDHAELPDPRVREPSPATRP